MTNKDAYQTQVYDVRNIMASLHAAKAKATVYQDVSACGELLLVIRGVVERYSLTDDFLLVMGRASPTMHEQPGLDLTPYQGGQKGVSRWHAMIYMEDGKLHVKDLGSTNGTFLSGKRLEPNVPTIICKGDDLTLGKLQIQLMFRLGD